MVSEVESPLFSLFSDFIRDLSKTFPEIKNSLYRNYETCLTDTEGKCLDDFPKLNTFLELIGEHEKMITDKNLEFFDLIPYYIKIKKDIEKISACFGNWEWNIEVEDEAIFNKVQSHFKNEITKLYNNGLIRLGYNVSTISDRDVISQSKNIFDLSGVKKFNKKIDQIISLRWSHCLGELCSG